MLADAARQLPLRSSACLPATTSCDSAATAVPGALAAIEQTSGTVTVVRSGGGGGAETALPGRGLFDGDFLEAAGGSAVVILAGGRRIAVHERGQLVFHAAGTDAPIIEAAGGRFVVLDGGAAGEMPELVIVTPAARIHPGDASIAFTHATADGLEVTLATEAAADAVVIENGFGEVVLRNTGEAATVAGPDQPPLLLADTAGGAAGQGPAAEATAAASGLTLAEGLDVSPGGDLAAQPEDAPVATPQSTPFDLSPQAAVLSDPAAGDGTSPGGAVSASGVLTEELWLLLGQGEEPGGGNPGITDPGTDGRLTGWEPLGLKWDILGSADVVPLAFATGPHGIGGRIAATEGGSMARVVCAGDGFGPVDSFLTASPEARALGSNLWNYVSAKGVSPASVSAIRSTSLEIKAGAELSFDWFFDPANQSPRRDMALFVVNGEIFRLTDSLAVEDASGWRTFVWRADKTATYTLGFVTVNDRLIDDPARLYVDNLRLNRTFGADYAVIDGGTGDGWRILAQKPALHDDSVSVGEDAPMLIRAAGLFANDTDPDPFDPVRLAAIDRTGTRGLASPGDGVITFDPAGNFEYLAGGETATTSFRYQADAGNGQTGWATVRVTVIGANDAPTARPDEPSAPVMADKAFTIDVLANDDDVDSDDDRSTLKIVAASTASGARVDFAGQPGAGIGYDPRGHFVALAEGETATDTITYTIADRHGARSVGTAQVTVTGVNDAPVAAADAAEGDEDGGLRLDVLANDGDPDTTDRLQVAEVDGKALTLASSVRLASGASVALSADGTLLYEAGDGFAGLAVGETATDSFHYRVADGHGGFSEATVTVRIAGRNDAPVATADAASGDAERAFAIAALANDGDIDSDDGAASLRIIAAQAATGEVSFSGEPGAGLVYDPAGRFRALGEGETAVDSITYTIADRHGAQASATIAVTVHGVNDAPMALADHGIASEDGFVTVAAAANDLDPDAHDRLTIVTVDGQAIAEGGQVTLASGAVVRLDAAGNLTWSPAGRFDGLNAGAMGSDRFRYGISDGHGGVAEAEVTVQIEGVNDAPIARPDSAASGEDGPAISIDVLANDDDIDADDDRSSLRLVGASASSGAVVTVEKGQLLNYLPAGHWDGLKAGETGTDVVTYTLADGHGARSTGTVVVTVTGVNDAPTAVADTLMSTADAVLRLPGDRSLTENDADPDIGDTRTIVAIDGVAANVGRTIELASGALLTVEADGRLTYDPNGRFAGLTDFERGIDSFTYTIRDASGATSTATATVEVQGVNDAPVAHADAITTEAGAAVRIPVLANDTDPDAGGNLRVLAVDSDGGRGSVRINADGTLTWSPDGGFADLAPGETATRTFRYVVDDFVGARSTGTVTITVVGQDKAAPAQGEILQSFEAPWTNATGSVIGAVVGSAAAPAPVAALFTPTHQGTMAVLTAAGGSWLDIERHLSGDALAGGRPLIDLADDPQDLTGSGAALRNIVSVGAGDVVDGHARLSFDWNFVSAEDPASGYNDYAVFTVTDGTVSRIFTLADARATAGTATGWRTSVFDLGSAFALPAGKALSLTVGFAVLNDASDARPSQLLVDNLRLNRSLAAGYEQLGSGADGFATFRERPVAGDDAIASSGGVALTEDRLATLSAASLLGNDHASAGAQPATLHLTGLDTAATHAAVTLAGGTIVWDPRGRFDELAAGETATDSFRYTLSDANGGGGSGRVTLTVSGLNDAPVAVLDKAAAVENGDPVRIDVLANDDDIDSDDDRFSLRVIAASAASGAAVAVGGLAGAGIVYDPRAAAAFAALGEGETLVDQVTYTIADRHGAQAQGLVAVTVTGRNDAPVAAADAVTGTEDASVVIAALANDHDPDRTDHLGIAAIDGKVLAVGAPVTLASGAVVSLAADDTLSWDPRNAYAALGAGQRGTDAFTYTVHDGHGGSSTALVQVSVEGRNDAPVAVADAVAASAGTRLTIAAATLLANDADIDTGDAVHVIGVDAAGATGAVGFDGTAITWDPLDRFRGLSEGETATDTFSYRVGDDGGAVATGSVAVTVHGVNDRPVALADAGTTDEDTAVTLHVLANDTDPDLHDRLSVSSLDTSGTAGKVTIGDDGSLLYDPRGAFDALNAGDVAYDTFRYRIADGHGGTDEASVTVTVTGRPDAERLVDSFEIPFSLANRSNASATTVTQYQETDGARGFYQPTDGASMARLEAAGGTTAAQTETFLGQPAGTLPKDIDGSFPSQGSAAKLTLSVQAGDEISFDWMFDARDFVVKPADGKADNDLAVFSVTGDGSPHLYLLSDVRHTGDQGASGWRTSVYTATRSGDLTLGFACVNDRVQGSPVTENSVLLLDNVRLNRAFGPGYQLVDTQDSGHFETLMHA